MSPPVCCCTPSCVKCWAAMCSPPTWMRPMLSISLDSFEEAIDGWRYYAQRFPHDNDGVILAATAGAINVQLGGEALRQREELATGPLYDDEEGSSSTPGRAAEVSHLRSVVGLVWRSVVVWMLLLALLTLARLLG